LTFQNVPTKSGGVVSGNISTGAGSPFGAGGKYEAQVRSIKEQIALKPEGFYDPPPMTLWKESNLLIESELEDHPEVKKAKEILYNLSTVQKSYNHRRFTSRMEKAFLQSEIDEQAKIINDIRAKITAEKNAPMIKAQQEQEALEADLIRKLEIELAVQRVLDKQITNQRPTPTPEPTPPAVTSSLPIIPIIIIAVIVGIFLLRRRA
jgi:hypothetical protein